MSVVPHLVRTARAGSSCRGRGVSRRYATRVAADAALRRLDGPVGSTCAGGGWATEVFVSGASGPVASGKALVEGARPEVTWFHGLP